MSSTFEHWSQSQNLDELLARSSTRYKSNSRPRAPPPKKTMAQNKSTYVRNRERRNARRPYPGRFGTDLQHTKSENLASQNSGLGLYVEHELPVSDNDNIYHQPEESPHEGQSRKSRKLNSFFGIDRELYISKPAESSPTEMRTPTSDDWDLVDFELDEPTPRHDTTIACSEPEATVPVDDWDNLPDYSLINSETSNTYAPIKLCGRFPLLLRHCSRPPVELTCHSPPPPAPLARGSIPSGRTRSIPDELFLPPAPVILWSRPARHTPKLKGYIASMRERHNVNYITRKNTAGTSNLDLAVPKEITLTLATPDSSCVGSQSQFVEQGLLAPPPTLYKKRQRQQKAIAEFINARELRVRRLSEMGLEAEEFGARRDAIMREGQIFLDI